MMPKFGGHSFIKVQSRRPCGRGLIVLRVARRFMSGERKNPRIEIPVKWSPKSWAHFRSRMLGRHYLMNRKKAIVR